MHKPILFMAVALAACAPKSGDTPSTAADSLAVMDSALAGDTMSAHPADSGLVADSVARADSIARADTTGTKMKATLPSKTKADSIIGRDSAFGPRYTIDKDGKLVEIKRPPIKRP